MARCFTCGRRVDSRRATCPADGTAIVSAIPESVPSHHAETQLPGFNILRVLGRGGFGTVYAARDEERAIETAIKVARPDAPEASVQLMQEVDVLRKVGPPYVPEVYSSGRLPDGTAYAALELIASPTLADRMERANLPFEASTFLGYAEATLAAVEAVHQRGFVHCDLKPENIFIDDSPLRARLVDFGLVRLVGEEAGNEATGDGVAPGSPDYMSPEQCRNASAIGIGADIYSLGVVFFEMLTGRVPFFGKPADVQEAHRCRRPPRLAEVGAKAPALEDVILRCLAKKSSDRFSSVVSLRAALRSALDARPDDAPKKPVKADSGTGERLREKRSAALLFFNSSADAAEIKSALKDFGGHLARAAVTAHASVFTYQSGDNPVDRAAAAARALFDRRLCARALVDVGTVTIQERSHGERHYFGALLSRADRYPLPSDPEGILLSEEAARVLTDPLGGCLRKHRPGIVHLAAAEVGPEPSLAPRQVAGPLVGREDVVEALLTSARAAVDSRSPRIATVIADPGHGKSRLCLALAEDLRKLPGIQLLQLRAREPSGGVADPTIRELLVKLLRIDGSGGPPQDGGRELLADRLGSELAHEAWAGAALALGWVSLESPELRPFAAAPGAFRSGAARAAGAAMRRRAKEAPLFLVLDDAQFADEATLDAIEYATLSEAESPIWVCVLARQSFETGRSGWAERCDQRDEVRLGPLTQEAASGLCRSLLAPAENVPAAAIQLLVDRTHGIPIQIVELVRALKDGGMVRQNARTRTWYLATDELGSLPDLPLVEWLAARELESLPRDLASHARLAAMLGADLVPEEIGGVLAELERAGEAAPFPLDAAVATKQLLRRGVLVERRREQLSFRHALVRDAVVNSVPESIRRPIHQAALRFYSGPCLLPPRQRLARLAFHAAQSGLPEVAANSYFALGEQAQSRHAYLEAESMYTRALEQMTSEANPRRLTSFRCRGLMRYRLGRYEDACKDFELARAIAHRLGELEAEIETLLDEATALDWVDEYRRSKELVEKAEWMARNHASPIIEARVLMGLGRSCVRFNSYERAAELYELAVEKAERLGDAAYETYVISLLHRGYVLASLGRLEESERAFNRVIPFCEERGDKLHLGAAIGNRFMLWTCRNDEESLLTDLHRLLQICREMGNGRMEQQAHFYLGLFLRWLGELGDAEKHARRAMEIDGKRLGEAARPESALLLARVLAAAGNATAARDILNQIQTRRSRAQERRDREFDLLPGEEVFFSMVDLASRESSREEWDKLRARAFRCLTGQDLIEFCEMRGRAARRRSEGDEALGAFQEAVRLAGQVPNVMLKRLQAELRTMVSS